MKWTLHTLTFILISLHLPAQEFSSAIEDNSFFIEEAYNQEEGVVQHIFTGPTNSDPLFYEFSFIQEWPVFSQTHQFSYTIPYLVQSDFKNENGAGDILLNYRYQLTNENGLAISPRFSLILPTGDDKKLLGDGVVGMQLNLPVSKRWHNEFITHFNAGLTVLPNVTTYSGKKTFTTYTIGGSAIYLANAHFNIMAELLYSSSDGSDELIFSPGIRYAINLSSMQIVPGLAFPFYNDSNRNSNGIFFYLSFEHPF